MDLQLISKIEKWKSIRKLLLDLLEVIPEEHLNFTVGKNMGTIGKQYRHIGDVQLCYVEAIKTGEINFSHYQKDYSLEKSKEKLHSFLVDIDRRMIEAIEKNYTAKINWFGQKLDLKEHLQALIEHEVLHQGELIVYIRTLEVKFPKSWEFWGL